MLFGLSSGKMPRRACGELRWRLIRRKSLAILKLESSKFYYCICYQALHHNTWLCDMNQKSLLRGFWLVNTRKAWHIPRKPSITDMVSTPIQTNKRSIHNKIKLRIAFPPCPLCSLAIQYHIRRCSNSRRQCLLLEANNFKKGS